MRTITTTTGTAIPLDVELPDLLAILEALFHEVTAKVIEGGSYENMNREINHLVSQMGDEDLRAYLAESLFLDMYIMYSSVCGRSLRQGGGIDWREP